MYFPVLSCILYVRSTGTKFSPMVQGPPRLVVVELISAYILCTEYGVLLTYMYRVMTDDRRKRSGREATKSMYGGCFMILTTHVLYSMYV